MSFGWAVILGFILGLRHATDADHVVAIGTLLHREPSPVRAVRLAAFWGLGHTITFALLGLAIVVAGVRLPERFEHAAELLVAAMLVALGLWTIRRVRRPPADVPRWRPLVIGVVHGLAGSAGIALLALTTIPSRLGALAYLALFCAGTVAGMIALTTALSLPLRWSVRRSGSLPRSIVACAGLLSVGFGVALACNVL